MRVLCVIPADKSAAFRWMEKQVMLHFDTPNARDGGTEVLRLSPARVDECVKFMRELCCA